MDLILDIALNFVEIESRPTMNVKPPMCLLGFEIVVQFINLILTLNYQLVRLFPRFQIAISLTLLMQLFLGPSNPLSPFNQAFI